MDNQIDYEVLALAKRILEALPKMTEHHARQIVLAAHQSDFDSVFTVINPFRNDLIDNIVRQPCDFTPELILPEKIKDDDQKKREMFETGLRQFESENFVDAIKTFQSAIQSNPRDFLLKEWLGIAYIKSGDNLRGLTWLESNLPPNEWFSLSRCSNVSYIYRELNQEDKEFIWSKRVFMIHHSNLHGTWLVQTAIRQNNLLSIVEVMSKLPTPLVNLLGFCLAYDKKDTNNASRCLRFITSNLRTKSVAEKNVTKSALPSAQPFIAQNNIEGGIDHFKKRIRKNSQEDRRITWALWRCLGDIYAHNGQFDNAVHAYLSEFSISHQTKTLHFDTKLRRLRSVILFIIQNKVVVNDDDVRSLVGYHDQYDLSSKLWDSLEKHLNWNHTNRRSSFVLPTQQPPVHLFAALRNVKSLNGLLNNIPMVEDFCQYLSQFGEQAADVISSTKSFVDVLLNYSKYGDLRLKQEAVVEITKRYWEYHASATTISDNDLRIVLRDSLNLAVAKAWTDILQQTDNLPTIHLRVLNEFLEDTCVRTSILLELLNESSNEVPQILVVVRNLTGGYEVAGAEEGMVSSKLSPGLTSVVTVPIQKKQSRSNIESFKVSLFYEGVSLASPLEFSIEHKSLNISEIENKYIIMGHIPYSSRETFKGRDDLLGIIHNAIAGGQGRLALFLNGLKRIGKTSVLEYLSASETSILIPILIRFDIQPPTTSGEFFYNISLEIENRLRELEGRELEMLDDEVLRKFDERPAYEFRKCLELTKRRIGNKKLFLMFDEFQMVTQAIAQSQDGRFNADVLDVIRGNIEKRNFLAIFTGSLLFEEIRRSVGEDHRLWNSITPEDVSFISDKAASSVLRDPVSDQGVKYSDAAVRRIWEHTHGYPIFVQLFGYRLIQVIKNDNRLVVSPQDVDGVSEIILTQDEGLFNYWWDHKRLHRTIDTFVICTILDVQDGEWIGVNGNLFFERALKFSINKAALAQRLEQLQRLHIIENYVGNDYKIKGLLLERWLKRKRQQLDGELPFGQSPWDQKSTKVALFVDHENLFQCLVDLNQGNELAVDVKKIAHIFLEKAGAFGRTVEKWSVANWNNEPYLEAKHQAIYHRAGWDTMLPDNLKKKESSDHKLRGKVHAKLEDHPDIKFWILVTGDGDFQDTARFLYENGKSVVVWAVRGFTNQVYIQLQEQNWIQLEYVEDIIY